MGLVGESGTLSDDQDGEGRDGPSGTGVITRHNPPSVMIRGDHVVLLCRAS